MAQVAPSDEINTAYSHYMNFELDSCRQILEKTTSDPWSFYLSALLISTEVFISDDHDLYKSRKSHESKLLDSLDELGFTEKHTEFLRSEIKIQWAILKLKNGDEFSAFWSLKQAYAIAKENTEKHPEFMPSYKTLGLLHVLYGVFPDKYNWILSILGIDGNVELGLAELQKVQQNDQFFSLESNLYSALLQSYLLNRTEEALLIMKPLYEKNELLLISYAYALILMKNAEGELAYAIINDVATRYAEPFNVPQIYYLYGEIYLQKNQPDSAIQYYRKFLLNHKGTGLVKDAYFKTGICYFLKNNTEKSNDFFDKAKTGGQAKNEADKYAEIVLERNVQFNKQLLKLRYATDGGYYENALKIHEEIDTTNFANPELSAYYYRSARLFHRIGDLPKAEEFYQKTIKFQEAQNWYFAPNAALQLAMIYKSKNNKDAAREYLRLINDYNGYPYQSSIRQKSKSLSKSLN